MGIISTKEDVDNVTFDTKDISTIIQFMKDKGENLKILTMAGAGLSTSTGIPDFRSSASGIYENVQKYNLESPMQVFELSYFKQNPAPFYDVVRSIYRPDVKPTRAHYFIRLLHEKGFLKRHYTQNVDDLEAISGLPKDMFIQAHGNFDYGLCLTCGTKHSRKELMEFIEKRKDEPIMHCKVENCKGYVKPNVVLFGEGLPACFGQAKADFKDMNLLIIMGTSLTVLPFCSLVHYVPDKTPRLYMNLVKSHGNNQGVMGTLLNTYVAGLSRNQLDFESNNKNDVFYKCDLNEGVTFIAKEMGWLDDLLKLEADWNMKLGDRPIDILLE